MSTKRPDSLEDFQRKQASKRAADDDLHYGSWGSAELATLETGRKAVSDFNKTIYRWFEIGEAIEIIRQKAERMNDRFAFKRIMRQQGFSMEKEDKVIDKSMVTKLKQVCDRKTEVIAWHETLTSKQKREWAAPNTVMKQFWTRDAQDRRINWNGQRIDPKGNVLDDNGQVVEKSPTQAEVDRQALAQAIEEAEQWQARVTELEEELQSARATSEATPQASGDVAGLETENVTARGETNVCSFCGRDFGPFGDINDETKPLDLFVNDDVNIAICWDCAKQAYISLENSRRLAKEAKAKAKKKAKATKAEAEQPKAET